MAYTVNLITLPGFTAETDLSAKQFYAVKCNSTAGHVAIVNATTDIPMGVLQNKPKAGYEAEIAIIGVAKMIAGTSVGWTAGVRVGVDSTGKAAPVASGTTRNVLGQYQLIPGQGTVALNQIISFIMPATVTRY